MKYFKVFNAHSNYENYIDSSVMIYPNLSYCKTEDHVHFTLEEPTIYCVTIEIQEHINDTTGEEQWDHYESNATIYINQAILDVFNTQDETQINQLINKFHNKYDNSVYGPIDLLYYPESTKKIGIKLGSTNYHDSYGDFSANILANFSGLNNPYFINLRDNNLLGVGHNGVTSIIFDIYLNF